MTTERETETDKQIAERNLNRIAAIPTNHRCWEDEELARVCDRLLAADAKLNEPVGEIARFMPVYSPNDGCWMEECSSGGKFVRYSDHLAAMRARVPTTGMEWMMQNAPTVSKSKHKRLLTQLIPAGWKLVPRKPTKQMLMAMAEAKDEYLKDNQSRDVCHSVMFEAAIDAAPKPE